MFATLFCCLTIILIATACSGAQPEQEPTKDIFSSSTGFSPDKQGKRADWLDDIKASEAKAKAEREAMFGELKAAQDQANQEQADQRKANQAKSDDEEAQEKADREAKVKAAQDQANQKKDDKDAEDDKDDK